MAQKKEVSAGTTAIVAYMRFEEREVAGDESEDSKTRTGTKKMQRQRVLYTANVGDARAVLWYAII